MKYLIDTPPPTISGNLHIGHIFSYTQGDIMARYQKYLGKDLIYPFCFDNNGIPTKKLASKKNIKGTKDIIDFSIERSNQYLDIFTQSGINFGEQRYHTYDDSSIKIANMAFQYLKIKGILYKKEYEYYWSEKLKTSISNSEIGQDGKIEKTDEIPTTKRGEGWFVNIMDHLSEIRKMSDKIQWNPLIHKSRIDDWIGQISDDWSISRERDFGIPIPGDNSMTFDTWFISSLTPQIAWCSHTGIPSLDCHIFDMRFQSHDIIRTWAFYTIAMSYFLGNQIPWKSIMITGHALDGDGDKFSKSSGNATNPIPIIQKYGIKGIRHWSTSSNLGMDINIDEEKMKMGWRIYNKFINARKFIQLQESKGLDGFDDSLIPIWEDHKKSILDGFERMDFNHSNDLIYKFLWNIFCDDWIERSKITPINRTLGFILDDFEPIFNIIYGD